MRGRSVLTALWTGAFLVLALALIGIPQPARGAGIDCSADAHRLAELRQTWRAPGNPTSGAEAHDLVYRPPAGEVTLVEIETALARRGALPDGRALNDEVRRLLRTSRDPGRLRQMMAVLDDDPARIRECLARPLLLRRRADELWRADAGFHAPGRAAFAARLAGVVPGTAARDAYRTRVVEWRKRQAPNAAVTTAGSGMVVETLAAEDWSHRVAWLAARFGATRAADVQTGTDTTGALARIPPATFSAIHETGERYTAWRLLEGRDDLVRMEIAWQPRSSLESWVRLPAGTIITGPGESFAGDHLVSGTPLPAETDCTDDTWSATTTAHMAPEARERHTAVWTGAEMIVWGGRTGTLPLGTGSAYDPALDTWITLPSTGAPSARYGHTAVWTGTEMIVWGGFGGTLKSDGAAYDPMMGTWTAVPAAGSPPIARSLHTAVWTDTEMIVWGGQNNAIALSDGAAYVPTLGTWTSLPTTGAPPSPRYLHTAVWADTEMIIWGGLDGTDHSDGARLDLAGGAWTALPDAGLAARRDHTAIWTGSKMLVWGGAGALIYKDGAGYAPAADTWTPLPDPGNALSLRHWHSAVWTGTEMIIWGGLGGGFDGARYHEAAGTWQAMGVDANTPTGRKFQTAVWTGGRMIVWGGSNAPGSGVVNSGGLYCAGCLSLDWHPDGDADTFGDTATVTSSCTGPPGWILDGSDCDDAEPAIYPGAPGLCDGVNNDCSDPAWPSLAGTEEVDNDGDGFSFCSGDCQDGDPTVWGIPGESRFLAVAGDERTLSWSAPLFQGADQPFYDILRSLAAGLWDAGSASCLVSDGALDRTADDPDEPAAGQVFHYLSRAGTACGESGVGESSQSVPRAGRTCP